MKPRTLLSVSLVLAMVIAGCGGSDEGAPTTQGSGQTADNGGDGGGGGDDGTNDGGDTAPPAASGDGPVGTDEDFPVPVPAGWEIDIYGELAEQAGIVNSGVQVLYPADDFDSIIAFYDDWTTSQPAEYSRTVAGDQVLYIGMESPIYWITVTANEEQRDQTWTLLQVVLTLK